MMKNASSTDGTPQAGYTAYDQLKSMTPEQRNEVLKDTGISFSDIQQYAEMMSKLHPDAQ